jgi:hypothetical protein
LRLVSPYDLDARYSMKRDHGWTGCKVHVSETCPGPVPVTGDGRGEMPDLITHVETTLATVTDMEALGKIHGGLAGRSLLPGEHLADSGYVSAENLVASRDRWAVRLVGPALLDHSAQARAGTGYDKTAFAFDFDTRQGTCPQGVTSSTWNPVWQQGRAAMTSCSSRNSSSVRIGLSVNLMGLFCRSRRMT